MTMVSKRSRVWRVILGGAVAAAFAVLTLLAMGITVRFTLGPVGVSVSDPLGPFAWGIVAATWLLVSEWRQPLRRRFVAGLIAIMTMIAVVAFTRTAAGIITDGDFAISELYVELATRGQLLYGPYSRFGWHHPGPLFFYVTAPFYALGGHRAPALYAVAASINLLAVITMAWVIARDSRRWLLAVTLVVGCALFAWRIPMFLGSPWTAHVPVLASLTFLVLAAAVASGSVTLLPIMIAFASFVGQTHVGFVPIIAVTTATAIGAAFIDRAVDRRVLWRAINWSAWIAALLWLLPIREAMSHRGGNVAALARFFTTPDAVSHSINEAFLNWSYGLSQALRPDFELPWGGHFEVTSPAWSIPVALVQLLLLATMARRDLKAGRRFEGALAGMAIVASVVALVSVTRIRGDILNHDIFRIAALGIFNLAIIAGAGIRAAVAAVGRGWTERPAVRVGALVLASALIVLIALRDLDAMTSFERRRTDREMTVRAFDAILDYMNAQGLHRPLFRIDTDQTSNAAVIMTRLEQRGIHTATEDESRGTFTEALAARGDEDVIVTLANEALHERLQAVPGNVVLYGSRRVYVNVSRLPEASRHER